MKNWSRNPKTGAPVEAKRWVAKKHVFSKQANLCFWARFLWEAGGPKPYVLHCFCNICHPPQKTQFWFPAWLHFGPSNPKTQYFTLFFDDFRGVVFEPQECPQQPRRWVKMASSPPVMVLDSTDHTHPFAEMIKKRLYVKSPTWTKVYRCRPYIYVPTVPPAPLSFLVSLSLCRYLPPAVIHLALPPVSAPSPS